MTPEKRSELNEQFNCLARRWQLRHVFGIGPAEERDLQMQILEIGYRLGLDKPCEQGQVR